MEVLQTIATKDHNWEIIQNTEDQLYRLKHKKNGVTMNQAWTHRAFAEQHLDEYLRTHVVNKPGPGASTKAEREERSKPLENVN